jgi:hypothetical protein
MKGIGEIVPPDSVGNTLSQFVYTRVSWTLPAASAGLITDSGEFESHKTYLPFALQELDILTNHTEMWLL